jgi:hypothetical protein
LGKRKAPSAGRQKGLSLGRGLSILEKEPESQSHHSRIQNLRGFIIIHVRPEITVIDIVGAVLPIVSRGDNSTVKSIENVRHKIDLANVSHLDHFLKPQAQIIKIGQPL